jgi:ankyrin repeat protein
VHVLVNEYVRIGGSVMVDATDGNGGTALLAAVKGGHAECACALLAAGAVDSADTSRAALIPAARAGMVECVTALLAAGPPPPVLNRAVDGAVDGGHAGVLRLLIDAGGRSDSALNHV